MIVAIEHFACNIFFILYGIFAISDYMDSVYYEYDEWYDDAKKHKRRPWVI